MQVRKKRQGRAGISAFSAVSAPPFRRHRQPGVWTSGADRGSIARPGIGTQQPSRPRSVRQRSTSDPAAPRRAGPTSGKPSSWPLRKTQRRAKHHHRHPLTSGAASRHRRSSWHPSHIVIGPASGRGRVRSTASRQQRRTRFAPAGSEKRDTFVGPGILRQQALSSSPPRRRFTAPVLVDHRADVA